MKRNQLLIMGVAVVAVVVVAALLFSSIGTSLSGSGSGSKEAYIIGVSNIKYESDQDSVFAADDAANLKNFLFSYAGFSENNTIYKLNQNATKSDIENSFAAINNDKSPKDAVIFYFGGHGEYLDSQNGYVIVPYDAPENLVTGTQLQNYLNSINTKNIICIFDCCKSGGFINDLTANNPNSAKYTILTACNSTESAHGNSEIKGIFTTFLIQGLKNKAVDTDINGRISIKEAFKYASLETIRYSSENGVQQHPQIYEGNPTQDVDLVKV